MYHDLNFFDNDDSIFNNINFTKTEIGTKIFKKTLSNYTNNVLILKNRQKTVKTILNMNITEINNNIIKIKDIEKDIYWLFDDKTPELNKLLDDIYFKYEWLNHGWILSLNANYKMYISVFIAAISPIISTIIPYFILYYYGFKMSFKDFINLTKVGYKSLSRLTIGTNSELIRYITNTFMVFSYFSNLVSNYENSCKYHKIINIIKNKMNSIDLLIEYTNKIKKIDIFSELNCDKDIINIEKNMGKKITKYKHKYLYFYKNITKFKDYIFNILNYIGNIDMFISISILVNKGYCFTNYLNKELPFFEVSKIFHPCLQEKNIKNDIIIDNNSLITGPNQSGKSVIMKSILISIILGQTIGISPAETCSFTIFTYLNSFINVSDNLGTSSLFEEEINRAVNIINTVNELSNNEFSFIIMDEIFRSTSILEGISIAFSFCYEISKIKNCLFFISTHFKYLTKIKNLDKYKTIINYDNNKNPIFTYKIENGISEDKIALKLLKNKMNNDIINNAEIINTKFTKKFSKF